MPCYNGHKISGSQPYLLDRDGHLGEQTMEEKFGVLPFCSWVESRTRKSYMSIFFLPHLQDHGLLRCRNFATKGRGLYQWPFLWSSLEGVVIYNVWRGSGKVRIFVYYLKILHIVALELQEEEINAEKIMAVTDAAPKAEIVSLTAMIFFAFSLWEWTELCVTINFINVQDNNNAEA